jgi:hypothetical protein
MPSKTDAKTKEDTKVFKEIFVSYEVESEGSMLLRAYPTAPFL